jgi:hypothetical protein
MANIQAIRNLLVAGTYYRSEADKATIAAQAGRRVTGYLEAEPANLHDSLAVAVKTTDGTHVGYVPASFSGLVAWLLPQAGGKWPCDLDVQLSKDGSPKVYVNAGLESA